METDNVNLSPAVIVNLCLSASKNKMYQTDREREREKERGEHYVNVMDI